MILRHLVYLAALARERHFGRAAEACHVSQATLSGGLRRLEDELGARLVERDHRYQGLTAEGERMVQWAQRILADCDGMRRELDTMRNGVPSKVRLGVIPTSLPVVSLISRQLHRRHEALTVSVLSLTSREIERELHDASIDVGVTYLENEPLRGVRSAPLYRERYMFVGPADRPYDGLATMRWADAAAARLCLLSPAMQHRRILDGAFASAGAIARPVVETNSISTLYAHVRDEPACTVMAHSWLSLFGVPPGMRAIPLCEPEVTQSIGLVWLDREPESLLARAVVDAAAGIPWDRLADTVGTGGAAAEPGG